MMALIIAIVILMSLTVLAAIFAIESKNIMVSIVSLLIMNIFVWGMLLFFHADIIAWIQLLIYGTGLTALFVVTTSLTEDQRDNLFDWKRSLIAFILAAGLTGILIAMFVIHGDAMLNFHGSVSSLSAVAYELWAARPTDVIIQSLLFFTTAVSIGALFTKQKQRKPSKEEIKS